MIEVTKMIKESGMVPVFNHADPDTGCRVVQACYDAGLRVFEWTNRGTEATRLFKIVKKYADKNCPGLLLGAGSIFNAETCRTFYAMGASFLVSPILDPDMAEACKDQKILWIPGCGTLTEIHQAQKWGAGIVKIFPGESVGGPAFVKAILGPMPWAQIMPTGGVTPDYENLKAWFEAGVCCVGMGSKLFTAELIADQAQLTESVGKTMRIIGEVRSR